MATSPSFDRSPRNSREARGAGSWDESFSILEQRTLLTDTPGAPPTEFINWHGASIETMTNSWVVTFQDLIGPGAAVRAAEVVQRLGVTASEVRALGRGGYASFTANARFTEQDVARVLTQMPDVRMVEPNLVYYTQRVPNDPLLSGQWGHLNNGQQIGGVFGVLDADVDATEAWDVTIGSQDVIIAVIDTGLQVNHPDLFANVWRNPFEIPGNGIDDDGNGYVDDFLGYDFADGDTDVDDFQGHGTAVAGVIGAVGDNGVGVAGVNWTVSILPMKVFSAFGGAALANIVAAHDYLTEMILRGVNIVASNNSYGAFVPTFFNQFFAAEEMAIRRFTDTGSTFIAAAGNDANDNDGNFTSFPASYQNPAIISVAATDNRDELVGFSNYGLTTVALAAPGLNVLTTSIGSGYGFISGTSFSSPYVAGAVGLLKAQKPNASHLEIRRALIDGADRVPALQGLVESGGRLNIANALRLIEVEGPRVISVFPGPVGSNVNTLAVQFDRAIDPAFVDASFIQLRRANGDNVFNGNDVLVSISNAQVSIDGATLTINLAADFPGFFPVDLYRLTLDADGFRDFNGNHLNGTTQPPTAVNDFVHDFRIVTFSGAFEPNDTLAFATPAVFNSSGVAVFDNATIGDGTNAGLDVDFYRIYMQEAGLIVAGVRAQNLDLPSSLDSVLRLFDASGAQLASNDNFNGLDSRIEFFVNTGGVYYVGVSGFGNSAYNPLVAASGTPQSVGDYQLMLAIDLAATDTARVDSMATPLAIPDGGVMSDTIIVTDQRALVDVNVRLDITHSFVSDLRVHLIAPNGRVVPLVLNRGGEGDHFISTVFDDEAAVHISAGSAPYTGSFRPETPLNALDGISVAGAWRLEVRDTRLGDAGTLVGWGLDFVLANNIFGPFELNDTIQLATATQIAGTGTRTFEAFIGDGAFGLRDVDLYRFTAAAGTTLSTSVSVTGGALSAVLRLFDAAGSALLLDADAETPDAFLTHTIVSGGTFYIGVSGQGNTTYNLFTGGSGGATGATGTYTVQVSIVGGISNGAVVVRGNQVALGVNADGSIGISTGPERVGVALTNIDFVVPQEAGATEAFWGATFDGFSFRNAGPGSQSDLPVAITNETDFANRRITMEGMFRGLAITRSFTYGVNDRFIAVDVTLTNTSQEFMTSVAWMEVLNPQTGLNRRTALNRTFNDVDNATGRLVWGTWFDNDFPGGLTIALGAAEPTTPGITVHTAVQSPNSVRDPYQIINNPAPDPDPMGTAGVQSNGSLAIAYDVGALEGGGAVTLRYFIFTGTTLGAVQGLFSAVENGTGTGHLVADPNGPALAPESLPYAIYYPEGYANDRASTFVPIVNPNSSATRVVVIARYEQGERDQVLYDSASGDLDGDGMADGTLAAHTRSGLTITTPALFAAGLQLVRPNEPYALEIRSALPMAANLSHFDFNVSTGEAFTSVTSTIWTVAEGFKGEGVHDFLVFYNPTGVLAKVTLAIYPEQGTPAFTLPEVEIAAFRRGGFSLADMPVVPNGPFGMRLLSDVPIVAALSHFDTNIGGGFGVLANPSAGSLKGATPEGQFGITTENEFVTVLNTNVQPAAVNFTFFFANGSAYRQLINIPGLRRGGFAVGTLPAFPRGMAYGIAYESNLPVSVALPSFSHGEATGSQFAGVASNVWLFADGFRPLAGGQVTEYLRLYNPTTQNVSVEITVSFNDGGFETFRRTVTPRTANEFNIHDFVTGFRREVGTVPGIGSFYGLTVKANEPIVAFMGHFDANFFGGFGTLGTPLGGNQPVI